MNVDVKDYTANYFTYFQEIRETVLAYAADVVFQSLPLNSPFSDTLPVEIQNLENCLYYITIDGATNEDIVAIQSILAVLKKDGSNTKYSRINKGEFTVHNSLAVLYIGKSKGKLKTRFKSHLNSSPVTMYALHLNNWIHNFNPLQFTLHYYAVPLDLENIDFDVLEILETAMHKEIKPILGRIGH